MTAGRTISIAGGVTNSVLDFSDGEYGKAIINAVTFFSYSEVAKGKTSMEGTGKLSTESSALMQVLNSAHEKITSFISIYIYDNAREKED